MEALFPTRGMIDVGDGLRSIVRSASAALVALVACAAGVLWIRRGGGHLLAPLPAPALVAAGCLVSLASLVFRGTHAPRSLAASPSLRSLGLAVLPTVVSLAAAAALSLRESSPWGLAALWAIVAAEEAASWRAVLRQPRRHRVAFPAVAAPRPLQIAPVSDESDADVADAVDDPNVSQSVTRRRDERGAEVMEGWVRAEFAAAQRHATVHVAICPPLERVPQCFAELGDGPPGDVKIAQVLPWGVRLEIKLDEPTQHPTTSQVEFSILDVPPNDSGRSPQ
jgi:hypothetical protein